MTLRPNSPELWEQALINGRAVHPSDGQQAVAMAMEWFAKQGGVFDGDSAPEAISVQESIPAPEPESIQADPLEPADSSHLPDEEFCQLMPQGFHATGDAEPVAEEPKPKRRRARHTSGTFRADDPATTEKDEAWTE